MLRLTRSSVKRTCVVVFREIVFVRVGYLPAGDIEITGYHTAVCSYVQILRQPPTPERLDIAYCFYTTHEPISRGPTAVNRIKDFSLPS